MARDPGPRLFTAAEYHQMAAAGILTPGDRVELIEGEIVQLPPIGGPHSACVARFVSLLVTSLGEEGIVWPQNPLRLDEYSEPQPDVAILRPKADFYAAAGPFPGDVLLAIEVSDSTLAYDRSRKLPLYARAGVPETWLVDLPHAHLEAHWDPSPDGYRQIRIYGRGESIAPQAFPHLELAVDAILG